MVFGCIQLGSGKSEYWKLKTDSKHGKYHVLNSNDSWQKIADDDDEYIIVKRY